MIEQLINSYRFNLTYAQQLNFDIPETDAHLQGGAGLENSPLFIIGHLVTGAGLTAASFHGVNTVDETIRDAFERRGPNDVRLPEFSKDNFTLASLFSELSDQHEQVIAGVANCSQEQWDAPRQWRLNEYFPTFADANWFMCVTHESLHLGQLAAWRRWYGLPSAMARL